MTPWDDEIDWHDEDVRAIADEWQRHPTADPYVLARNISHRLTLADLLEWVAADRQRVGFADVAVRATIQSEGSLDAVLREAWVRWALDRLHPIRMSCHTPMR